MAKQDEWIRITLRVPPQLHEKLISAASTSSMNAEIIERLDQSFDTKSNVGTSLDDMINSIIRRITAAPFHSPPRALDNLYAEYERLKKTEMQAKRHLMQLADDILEKMESASIRK